MSPSTVRLIIIISSLSEFMGVIFLSLGLISPQTVKAVGEKLHALIVKKPDDAILKHAFMKTFETKIGGAEGCLTQFAVAFMTSFAALLITCLALLGFSIWGFIALLHATKMSLYILLPIIGVLLAIAELLAMFGEDLPVGKEGGLGRLVKPIIDASNKISDVLYPLHCIVEKIVSVFTLHIPLLWYHALKIIHSRGVAWAFGLSGVLLMFVSMVLQLIVSLNP